MNESMRFTANTATKKGTAFSAFCARGGKANARNQRARGPEAWSQLKEANKKSIPVCLRKGLRTIICNLNKHCERLGIDPVEVVAQFSQTGELPPVEKPK